MFHASGTPLMNLGVLLEETPRTNRRASSQSVQCQELLQYAASVPRDVTFTAVLCEACLPWWEDAAVHEEVRWEIEDGRDAEEYPCYALLVRIFAAVFRETTPGVRDPLKALKECVDYEKIAEIARGSSSTKRLCSGCDWAFREWVPQARQKLWRKLPEYFDVEVPSPS